MFLKKNSRFVQNDSDYFLRVYNNFSFLILIARFSCN
jgi:hypothetical protein